MKSTTTSLAALLAFGVLSTTPALGQVEGVTTLGEEAETDIEIINGVPVDPALKAKLMEADEALSVKELLDLSQKTLGEQQGQLDEQKQADDSWMQGGDPLGHLEGEMHGLVKDIDRSDTSDPTQARGEDVVRKMDTLIAMLEKACSACAAAGGGSGSGQGQGQANGNSPADESTLSQGPGGSGDLNAAGEGNNRFEDLDPEQREAILRAQQEQQGLPPEYSALLSEYYQRLASEKALETGDADDAGPQPADTPDPSSDAPGSND